MDFTKTALLVIDMQKDFYGEGGNAQLRGKPVSSMQALPRKITEFAQSFRKRGAKIIFTKFIYDPSKSPRNYTEMVETTRNKVWMCQAASTGAEFDGIDVHKDDVVIEKYLYDAFAGTELKDILISASIENIVITGVRTEICVLATASRSFAEGYRTFVVSDLVGTYDDKRDISDAILDSLRYSAFVVSSRHLLNSQ